MIILNILTIELTQRKKTPYHWRVVFQELQSVFITFTTHTSSSVFLNGNYVDAVVIVVVFSVNNDDIDNDKGDDYDVCLAKVLSTTCTT